RFSRDWSSDVCSSDLPDVICQVIIGGQLSSRKGVSLPGVDVDLPPLTKEDVEHIRFGVRHGVDFIAASFVRRAEHVEAVRRVIRDRKSVVYGQGGGA